MTPTPDELPPDLQDAYEILASGAAQILPADGLVERLTTARREARPLRVKLGIDPSGSDLTLGHAVVLRKLRQFQDLGHVAVLVVGGFTGQVGDPSGRTNTRSAQSAEDVVANAAGYFDQLMTILDRDRTEVVNNADWLGAMSLADILGYTRQVTVAQLLERDDFARRFKANAPISLSEFVYPLLQGIDSVEIHADIELGGTDQTFNNLVGRELQRSRGQDPQAVLTVPLLVGTDGVEKMGKSLGNYVAIAEPAPEQFGKLMSVPDGVVGMYARLCTALHPREVDELEAEVAAGGAQANRAKRAMARAVVGLYHGDAAARQAEERFDAVFRRNEVPADLPGFALPDGDPIHLPALLVASGLATSSSQARRDIDAGAVRVESVPVPARRYDVARSELVGAVLASGKRRMVRLT
ncbi:tyrosine--tRNA ligase [Jatrophihabitans endophyticus]|uniref:tyrosine--tRNA ligase n=1 Tax=Jatrophihabitans endophyticus TaxID=1206085 RepID=UPI001A01DFA5|nr:tyrosine--tRNA ligase [Jatrophihabitans endophyticus]MBE7188247.1 tyrosine--tRNA ligase [Jatrophihabitans endophyticus]